MIRSLRLISVLFIFTVLFSSCKKDDSNPTDINGGGNTTSTITLNGDGFSNKQVTISAGTSGYSTANQVTGGTLSCSDNIQVTFIVPGNQTGTFNFSVEETSSDILTGLLLVSGTGTNAKQYGVMSGSGSITISSYGAVGSAIKGSFTGKIYNVLTQAEVTISGSFSAIRVPDSQ